ncbi:MAG: serine/threonine protein kinase [Planctomycetaceae bacterium]|nr:serine/threonine protein kinase [Planctomycetaceae bacterium]
MESLDVGRPTGETLAYDAATSEQAISLSLADDVPPSTVPGYLILQRIGAGKFGSVWLAREQNTGKHVAIKFYSQRRGVDWALLGREVEKLAVLYTSRNIVGLIAVGWEHDPPYYVMEYLENGSLAQRLAPGPLPVSEAVRIGKRVAQALVHAHGSGILHCDIKPANVLLDQDYEPRLCDFGQSRLAEERSHSLGTLFYMAPEQADLHAVPDTRWDVYALGALLYHMLVGEPPFRTDAHETALRNAGGLQERIDLYRQFVTESPRPLKHRRVPGVDPALADIIDRCLAIDPARRLPNPQTVLDRLNARERQRARRPLIVTGLILPLLLVLSVLPFALDALRDAVTTSRSNLVSRALESDALSATLLAGSLQRELDDRLNELLAIADDDAVREAITAEAQRPLSERQQLFTLLDRKKRQVEQRRAELGRSIDASWFLQDAQGYQRWRAPLSDTIDQAFACRDYFHGQGSTVSDSTEEGHLSGDCRGMSPIQKPHVAAPYSSQTSHQWKIALSVPVFDRAEGGGEPREVIGVLARSLNLSALLDDYQEHLSGEAGTSVGRQLALVDGRSGVVLAHPWLTEEHLKTVERLDQELRLDPALAQRLVQLIGGGETPADQLDRTDRYRDPVASLAPVEFGGEWLAAFAPIGRTGWIAVVQERRDPVLAPVEHLRERLVSSAVWGIVMVCGVVGGCWWLIVGLLSDRKPIWLRMLSRRTAVATPTLSEAGGRGSESA